MKPCAWVRIRDEVRHTVPHLQAEGLQQSSSAKFEKLSENGKQGVSHDLLQSVHHYVLQCHMTISS